MALTDFLPKDRAEALDLTYLDDRIICSGTEAWTYVLIPGEPLNIPTEEDLDELAERTHKALERLENREFHYYSATRPLDTVAWYRRMLRNQSTQEELTGIKRAPAFNETIFRMAEGMHAREYKEYGIYLGVRLGFRKAISSRTGGEGDGFFKRMYTGGLKRYDEIFGGVDKTPKKEEIMRWGAAADSIRAELASSKLQATPAPQEEVYALVHHITNMGMNISPRDTQHSEKWGAGWLNALSPNLDNSDPNILHFHRENPRFGFEYSQYQEASKAHEADPVQNPLPIAPERILHSYATAMAVELPNQIAKPWVLDTRRTEGLPPTDVSIRFRVVPKSEAKKKAQRAKQRLMVNISNQHKAGIEGGNDETQKLAAEAEQHARELAEGRGHTQMEYTARMYVHGTDKNAVTAGTQELISFYADNHSINLLRIEGAQKDLWNECIPAQSVKPGLYKVSADIETFTNGHPFTVEHLGYEKDGYYMGYFGRRAFLHDTSRAARLGMAPTVLFNGSLGGGKTVGVLFCLDLMLLAGYTCIYIDPKKDAKSMLALRGRGHMRVWSLTNDGLPGILDPFTLLPVEVDKDDPRRRTPELAAQAWREETLQTVMDTLDSALSDYVLDTNQHSILNAVATRVINEPNPSMHRMLELLGQGDYGQDLSNLDLNVEQLADRRLAASNLATLLKNKANTELGRFIFGKKQQDLNLLIKGVKLTIIDISGLTFPAEGQSPTTPTERMSVTLFSLITAYSWRLLNNKHLVGARGFFVDEYTQIKDSPSMKVIASRANKMGRSLNIIPHYADQSITSSLDNSAFRNAVGSRFVFRSSLEERQALAKEYGRKEDDDLFLDEIPGKAGAAGLALAITPPDKSSGSSRAQKEESLGKVQLDIGWNAEYLDAFETNDNPAGRPKGWKRAAYRTYPLDAFGILHDPLSDELQDRTGYADPEPETPMLPTPQAPVSAPAPKRVPASVSAPASPAPEEELAENEGWL